MPRLMQSRGNAQEAPSNYALSFLRAFSKDLVVTDALDIVRTQRRHSRDKKFFTSFRNDRSKMTRQEPALHQPYEADPVPCDPFSYGV